MQILKHPLAFVVKIILKMNQPCSKEINFPSPGSLKRVFPPRFLALLSKSARGTRLRKRIDNTTLVSSEFKKAKGIVSKEGQGTSPEDVTHLKGLSSFQIRVRKTGSGRLTGGLKV